MKNENEFIAHGYYVVSNTIGYEIQLNRSNDEARIRTFNSHDREEITDWLPIEFVADEDSEDGDSVAVIDPTGWNVPLNQVIRIEKNSNL